MKTYLVVLLILIFIAPVNAQTPALGDGWHDSYELALAGLIDGSITNTENADTVNLVGDSGIFPTSASTYVSFTFQGTGLFFVGASNGGEGDICVNATCTPITTSSTTPYNSVTIYSITGLAYGVHSASWRSTTGNLFLDALYIVPGDLPTSTPGITPTEITFYPTATPIELGTAISEVLAEMTVEVTVILPEATDEPYGVPMLVEGTTGTQDALFEYRATAGDSLITLTLVILIVLAIAQLGVMLWKR